METRKKSLKLAIQSLIVVILLKVFLYNTVQFSTKTKGVPHCSHEIATRPSYRYEKGQCNFPSRLNTGLNSHEDYEQSQWLLAAAGSQTKKTYVSFNDVTDICTTFSEEEYSSHCATNTIASVLLLSDSLLSLRSELINFTTPHLSDGRPLSHNSDPLTLLDLRYPDPSKFPRAIPDHLTDAVGSSIYHTGYYCPFTSTCNNPVFSVSTHENIPLLFTFLPSILGTHTEVLKFGFGNATGYYFATNGFAPGGFDVLLEKSDSIILDPKEDYSQMKHEVDCLLSDGLELPGLFFNILPRGPEDHSRRFRGLHGAISPWTRSEKGEIERMKTVILPERNMITCAMAVEIRHSMRARSWVWYSLFGLIAWGVILLLFGLWENRHGRIRL